MQPLATAQQMSAFAERLASCAASDTLSELAKVVTHGYKEQNLVDMLVERQVPFARATWFVRVTHLNGGTKQRAVRPMLVARRRADPCVADTGRALERRRGGGAAPLRV